jgi:hypothetical protein
LFEKVIEQGITPISLACDGASHSMVVQGFNRPLFVSCLWKMASTYSDALSIRNIDEWLNDGQLFKVFVSSQTVAKYRENCSPRISLPSFSIPKKFTQHKVLNNIKECLLDIICSLEESESNIEIASSYVPLFDSLYITGNENDKYNIQCSYSDDFKGFNVPRLLLVLLLCIKRVQGVKMKLTDKKDMVII